MERCRWWMGAWTLAVGLLVSVGLRSAGALTVAGFGDSLTAGRDYLDFLPPQWNTINLGQPGEESWNGVPRLLALLPGLQADVVVVMEGTNDVRNPGYTLQRSVTAFETMIDAVLASGFAVVLMAPPPLLQPGSELYNERLRELASRLHELARSRGVPFLDLFPIFLAQPDLASLYRSDGVHLVDPGRVLVATAVTPRIRDAAAQVPEPQPAALGIAAWGSLVLLGAVSRATRRLRSTG